MTATSQRRLKVRKILFASLLALILLSIVLAAYQQKTGWSVPDEAKQRKNPLQPTASNISAAKDLYLDNCVQCHGASGKGDGTEAHLHDPRPSDLSDRPHAAAITDGELFFKISQGRKPMPAFKKRLTEDQRWQLVLFVRSFSAPAASPNKIPATPPTP
jgi:mono/diheme cytochrome c family protein